MSRLEIILSAILLISIIMNVGLFVYARNVVAKLLTVSNELLDLGNMVDAFTQHLESVYQLEMFYGDQTLESLIEHARSFNEQMDTFDYIYQYAETPQIEAAETMEIINDNTD